MNDGLGLKKPGGNKLYLNTFGGQFRSRVTEKNPAIPGADIEIRKTSKGKEVTECLVYSLEGKINSIYTNTKVNGGVTFNEFVINLQHDSGKEFVLTFNQTSSDTFDILNRMLNPSFDPTSRVKLAPYMIEKDNNPGKYNQGVVIYQNSMGSNFSKEDKIDKFVKGKDHAAQLGIPPWEKQQTDQGVVYKKKPQLTWFLKKVMDKIVGLGGSVELRQDGEKQVSYLVFPTSKGNVQTAYDGDVDPLAQAATYNNGPSAAEQARMLHGEPKQPVSNHVQHEEEDEDDLPF